MIKIILAAAFLSFAMFAPSKANPISAVTTMSQSSALDVVKIQRREGRGRKRGLRNRGYRRGYDRGFRRGYRSGWRRGPRGWRRYYRRPYGWRDRGCIVIGPVWYCP
jgi:hypothetical protein